MPSLATVELNPESTPRASILWLHGLGADGYDFKPIVPELRLPPAMGIRFVFPHAPLRPVTLNQGHVMRAWYDIATPDLSRTEDVVGIRASETLLRELIQQEVQRGTPTHRIMLVGFSQGGAMALHTGLRYPEPLAGILALSAYLPLGETLAAEAHPANAAIPIMIAHGWQDGVIPLHLAQASRNRLQGLGYQVEWHVYAMAHGLCLEEVATVCAWLQRILA